MQQLLLMGHTDRALVLLDGLMHELALTNPTRPLHVVLALLARRGAVRLRKIELARRTSDDLRPIDRARIDLTWDAAAGLALVDPLRAQYFQSLSLDLCFRHADAPRLARALIGEAPYLASAGRMSRRLEDILALAERAAATAELPALALLARGTTAFFLGHWAESLSALAATERSLLESRPRLVDDAFGLAQLLGMTRSLPLASLLYLGRLADLDRRTTELLIDALERNDVTAATYLRTGTQAVFELARDDVDAAVRNADAGLQPWRHERGRLAHFMDLQARCSIDLYVGRGDAAYLRARDRWSDFERSMLLRVHYVRTTLLDLRGRAALAAASRASGPARRELLAEASRLAKRLEHAGPGWPAPLASALRGGVAMLDGDRAAACSWLDRAARGFAAAAMPLHAAAAGLSRARCAGDEQRTIRERRVLVDAGVRDPDRFGALLCPAARR